jgi:hypothetical protein
VRGYLRALGLVFLIGGLATCAYATTLVVRDETFFKAGEALARHPEHLAFKSEYYEALIWHLAYLFVAIMTGLMGLVGSAVLLGLHAVLRRIDQVEASLTRQR